MIEYTVKALQKLSANDFGSLLNVGARDVSPGIPTVRDVFKNVPNYAGIDLFEGRDVTKVMNAHDIKEHFEENSFDLVVSTDTLEHDDKFWVTVENMRWATRPGGTMFIAVPGGATPFHEWPGDYWRFMKSGVEQFFAGWKDVTIENWDLRTHFIDLQAGVMELNGEFVAWGKKPNE